MVKSHLIDGKVEFRHIDRVGDPEAGLVVGDRRRLGADLPLPAQLPLAANELTGDVTLKLEPDAVVRHLQKSPSFSFSFGLWWWLKW